MRDGRRVAETGESEEEDVSGWQTKRCKRVAKRLLEDEMSETKMRAGML